MVTFVKSFPTTDFIKLERINETINQSHCNNKYIDLAKTKSRAPDPNKLQYNHIRKKGFVFLGSETQKMINYEHLIVQSEVHYFFSS